MSDMSHVSLYANALPHLLHACSTLFLAHKGITGSINQHIILSTTTDNKWTLRVRTGGTLVFHVLREV